MAIRLCLQSVDFYSKHGNHTAIQNSTEIAYTYHIHIYNYSNLGLCVYVLMFQLYSQILLDYYYCCYYFSETTLNTIILVLNHCLTLRTSR